MRPDDRYKNDGPEHLGDAELLAVVLGTGGHRAPLQLAADLLSRFEGLDGIAGATPQALADVPGLGEARAVRVHAALQAGRRSLRVAGRCPVVRSPDDAWAILAPGMRGLGVEELHALYLDRRCRPIARRVLTRGSDGFTVVDPRQVFRPAVSVGATAVVLAHNHPSGDPTPSAQDRDVTRRVANAGRVLGIQLVDHLVIADGGFASLASDGELPRWPAEGPGWTAQPSVARSAG